MEAYSVENWMDYWMDYHGTTINWMDYHGATNTDMPQYDKEKEVKIKTPFYKELENLINSHSVENESNTPDFILMELVKNVLESFNKAVNKRQTWYDEGPKHEGTENV